MAAQYTKHKLSDNVRRHYLAIAEFIIYSSVGISISLIHGLAVHMHKEHGKNPLLMVCTPMMICGGSLQLWEMMKRKGLMT